MGLPSGEVQKAIRIDTTGIQREREKKLIFSFWQPTEELYVHRIVMRFKAKLVKKEKDFSEFPIS